MLSGWHPYNIAEVTAEDVDCARKTADYVLLRYYGSEYTLQDTFSKARDSGSVLNPHELEKLAGKLYGACDKISSPWREFPKPATFQLLDRACVGIDTQSKIYFGDAAYCHAALVNQPLMGAS